ncbi:MAG: substrate-binding domain-containing protein [Anaerolineales bacterium]|nr:substrate-binding domain-containing protein [Anaerolineales bacterium]MDW8278194.1 substrate-binding domain-containing protein [Anaerolineales bacterium]
MSTSLASKQFLTIGVLAGWQFYRTATTLSYLEPIFRGISHAAQTLRCHLLLACGIGPSASPGDPYRPAWPIPSAEHDFVPVGPWNTDGLIVVPPLHSSERSAYIEKLRLSGFPIFFIGSGEIGPTLLADNASGIRQAVQHLAEHGRRKIAFIAGSPDDLTGDSGERLHAFQQACRHFGLEQDPRRVLYGRHVYDGGFAAAQQFLQSGVQFDALLASNDESAIGAIHALRQAGRRIPEDVAVIGFDNRLEGAVQQPALTSVHIPLFEMGVQATHELWRHLTEGVPLPERRRVETHLVVRQSCGCGGSHVARVSSSAASLGAEICAYIHPQVYGLREQDLSTFSHRLVETFEQSLSQGNPIAFRAALEEILTRTVQSGDDAHLWQEALSFLSKSPVWKQHPQMAATLLDEARLTISARMRDAHRQHVLEERWTFSRLSLLTARLLTVLDEAQVYDVLASHLPEFGIQTALVALFEPEGQERLGWSVLRDALNPRQPLLRLRPQQFPPPTLLTAERPFSLALVPITDQTGQIGFMALDTARLDLHGAIVQQLGSALNTVRLYRQATEARRAAEEANRLKSRFLSTISHELRAPLHLIVGLSGLLLDENEAQSASLPESARRDIERVHAYAQHLGGLINDVIDLASSGAGQLRLQYEPLDLTDTLRIVAESGAQMAQDKGLTWRADLPEQPVWVWGDRTRLRQAALNLVSNAIKFTPRGEVRLSLQCTGGQARVEVSDTGPGIPPQEQTRIFEAFHRTERSVAEGQPGLGLGLTICKMLVEMHGGQVGVSSSGLPGEGACFWFTLPEISPASRQPAPAASSEKKVLFLFQSPLDLPHLTERLAGQNIRVLSAPLARPADWQALLAVSPPQAIALEIEGQPGLAWRAMQTIKSLPSAQDIPILFYAVSDQGEALLSLDYLTKPVEPETLLRALDENLPPAETVSQQVRTFLAVDDDLSALEMYARILRLHSPSNRVLAAQNGHQALKILLKEKIDLVLLDLQMPEMDGFAVLQAMREAAWTRDIPVIVITGKNLSEEDLKRLNDGVAVVLQKGVFSMEETIARISAALERKRRLSQDAQRLVRQAMLYIHQNYAQPISRAEIARHVNITEDYLTFCFRQELGTTPIKYLQRYRIQQAKTLLKTTTRSVSDIALEVGFSDSGYFTRIFHRETGLAPEVFRHQPT